ncbi:MAG TPA: hypothetical protein VK993_03795 [Chthoniobacterales bacterium]|nr:hypothetical protein [Chthoniobacterales bacterium]
MQPLFKGLVASLAFAAVSAAAAGFGFRSLLNHEHTPGAKGVSPTKLPPSYLQAGDGRPALVMTAHPRCPCTRASLGELAQIMARLEGQLRAYVLFVTPETREAAWEDSDVRRSAENIPGVTVLPDVGGVEAHRFGAETSGHTLLFAADGSLLFSGGITQSRGHAGANAGASAIVALVSNQQPGHAATPVFGCSLTTKQPGTR